MCADLRDKLVAALVPHDPKVLFYAKGCKHPPYNALSVEETLRKFTAEVLPACPITDPRGKKISIVRANFPKLAGLKHLTLSKDEFCASDILAAIDDGTFNLGDYDDNRDDRLRTLFWLPDVLRDPDAIYKNAHKIVFGDEVHILVYNKMGSTVKLVFTMDIKKKGKIIRTVPITSFLTDPATAMSYVKGDPLYSRENKKATPKGG